MKSRITIEIDFENNNSPYLNILHIHSDDVRDKLLKNFLEQISSKKEVTFKVDYSYPNSNSLIEEYKSAQNIKFTPK